MLPNSRPPEPFTSGIALATLPYGWKNQPFSESLNNWAPVLTSFLSTRYFFAFSFFIQYTRKHTTNAHIRCYVQHTRHTLSLPRRRRGSSELTYIHTHNFSRYSIFSKLYIYYFALHLILLHTLRSNRIGEKLNFTSHLDTHTQ